MVLLAKRVSACVPAPIITSTSDTPSARATAETRTRILSQRFLDSRSSLIGAADLDSRKTRRARAVARAHYLLRLALSAVRRAPQCPMLGTGDGGAGIPEFRADAAVARILEHPQALAVADLPGDLAAELEVVALI